MMLELLGPVTPIARWGHDHWSTLAYLETRVVDHGGLLRWEHMRGHMEPCPAKYPTQLRDGLRGDHDDFGCVDDMHAYGLVSCGDFPPGLAIKLVDNSHPYELTPLGTEVCALLRIHKQNGGNFASFRLPRSVAFRCRTDAGLWEG